MTFDQRTILITGGARGIGKAVAEKLFQLGANLILADLEGSDGESTVRSLDPSGNRVKFIACDVTQQDQVNHVVGEAVRLFGRLDGAVNNAGIGGVREPLVKYPEDDWDRVISVNLTGIFYCLKAELLPMLQAGSGSIVNIASMAGLKPFPLHPAYAASKHGVVGLSSSAAWEYAGKGIRVNAICPSFTKTAMVEELASYGPGMEEKLMRSIPMRRLGTTEEIADAIVWLLSEESSFVTGVALPVSGGM